MSQYRTSICFGLFVIWISYNGLKAVSLRTMNTKSTATCGYDGCPTPDPNMLNVHIVAHTHDDVGWLETVDNYYYGSKVNYQSISVRAILDSVIQSLLKDPNKRFIYVESAFFFKWWDQQTGELKEQVKMLVNEGRLEFIGGAWSMNDEATTHYQSVIDQFTWGLRKLNDTFGECGRPKVGWQIDPFGHSREMASLLAQMKYDGLFLGRIDYEDKKERFVKQTTEMIWQTSQSLGSNVDLFTGVLYNTYSPPPGFCFDILCNDIPVIDDKTKRSYNIDSKIKSLLFYFETMKSAYPSNNILITMGNDFNYQDAPAWFDNVDKLIHHINARKSPGLKVNMFYSTPSCYLKAVHDSNITLSTKTDDFFPYASDSHSFWTGNFTSRPTLKRFERVGNHYLQVCKQLSVLANKKTSKFDENLTNLREAMGIMQHHDAVSGTEKQHVADDYARLLQIGIDKCSENINEALNQLSAKGVSLKFDFETCADLNISSCAITEKSDKFMVTLYNSLAHSTSQYVRLPIPVSDDEYEVLDHHNVVVNTQLVPIPDQIRSLFYRQSIAEMELVFLATEVPPVGYKSYFVQKKSKVHTQNATIDNEEETTNNEDEESTEDNSQLSAPFVIGNEDLSLTFGSDGLLESVTTKQAEINVRQNFYLYKGYSASNILPTLRSSGAYIFRPNGTEASEIVDHADVKVVKGDLVDEVHQTFNKWISQVVRVYKEENYAEFQWLVGPIPIDDGMSREIITRFDTDIESNGIFYTDSNGREMIKRKRDHRDTWDLTLLEKISGNYYPITTKIAIEDEKRRLAILTDRAQGGSSLTDGSIEIMVHRRLLHDDAFGVGEALNETAFGRGLIARGSHYLVLGPKNQKSKLSTEAIERFVQLKTLLPNWLFFSEVNDLSYTEWMSQSKHTFSGLSHSLPKNVHLLTFEPWKLNSILVRFEHILEKDDDEKLSEPVTLAIERVFQSLNIVSIRETTLAANQWLDEAKRLDFTSKTFPKQRKYAQEKNVQPSNDALKRFDKNVTISINPMEIRSFIIELE